VELFLSKQGWSVLQKSEETNTAPYALVRAHNLKLYKNSMI